MNIPANVLTPLSRESVFNNKRFADLYARLCEIALKLSREREWEGIAVTKRLGEINSPIRSRDAT